MNFMRYIPKRNHWFPNLTRAYENNGRCPRQKFVFGIDNDNSDDNERLLRCVVQIFGYNMILTLRTCTSGSKDSESAIRRLIAEVGLLQKERDRLVSQFDEGQ